MPENGKKIVSKNTWSAKGLRFFTAIFPISQARIGSCRRCGACCKLPKKCPFLAFDKDGLALCKVYRLRSLSCRKYPRTSDEHLTCSSCGFSFKV
jgi:Fe-S-cluster containining protein